MKNTMKRKKNQRIERITDSTLVVGADIAKHTHVARALDFRGIELGRDCWFQNDRQGLEKLTSWMKELQQAHHKTEIVLGIEPTGHYWFPLAQFLEQEGIKVVIVNPHHVNKSKELEDNSPTKNDYKDAKVIANLVRNGHYSEPKIPQGVYADLRVLMNLREKVMDAKGQAERRIQNWLDRYFPEYTEVFKTWDGKASLIVLREFPTPEEITRMGVSRIVERWKKDVKRAVGQKRAERLVSMAKQSIGLLQGLAAARMELQSLLEQYDLYVRQEQEIMEQVAGHLENISGTAEMLTMPGVSFVTVAGFLAEVGDLSGYQHGQQIVRLAGLNLKENSSGKRQGLPGITKRGRSRLRALLYRAVLPMAAHNKEFKALHTYYTKRSHNPLKKKQSLIALACKLIRVLYTLGTRQKAYHATEVLGPKMMTQLQMTA